MARRRSGVRVIAGAAKGRRIETPEGDATRPITDRVKESLFGHLMPIVGGARVLDLYAGSGAIGLEALSRGAASARFVERDRDVADLIARNIEHLGMSGDAGVDRADVAAFVRGSAEHAFDLVFLDPPYALATSEVESVLSSLAANGWVAIGSTVVVRRPRDSDEPSLPDGFESTRVKTYGDTVVLVAAVTREPGT